MSLFRNIFNLDPQARQAGEGATISPDAPLPAQLGVGETDSVRTLVAQLSSMPPARARYIAAFAYLLGRAANATNGMSDAERAAILEIAQAGGLEPATAPLIVDLAAGLAGEFGGTEDFVVTREFKALADETQRLVILRACFAVMAANGSISAEENAAVNQIAAELDIDQATLNSIRGDYHDQLSSVQQIRRITPAG